MKNSKNQLDLEELVSRMYEIPFDENIVDSVQRDMCLSTGGVGIQFVLFDRNLMLTDTKTFSFVSNDFAQSMESEYIDYYHKYDVSRAQRSIDFNSGLVLTNEQLTPDAEKRVCPLYNDFFPKFSSDSQIIYGSRLASGKGFAVSQARSSKDGEFDDSEIGLFQKLSTNLLHSFNQRERLIKNFGRDLELKDLAHRSTDCLFLVDEFMNVQWLNTAAQNLISENKKISLIRRRLLISNVKYEHEIKEVVKRATRLSTKNIKRVHITSLCDSSNSEIVSIFSFASSLSVFSDKKNYAVILVRSLAVHPEIDHEMLAKQYHLTKSETKLALGLSKGLTIKEYADINCLSQWTVRSTLKILFDKTESHSQQELIRKFLIVSGNF